MSVAIITGSAGLIGSQAVEFFAGQGFKVVGIDNNMRRYFFGKDASTEWNLREIRREIQSYQHNSLDIRDTKKLERIFKNYSKHIKLIIHAAAQPSHDWAAREPLTDFTVNANGTLNLLEMTRRHCPKAVFIFVSTNKVYGDLPNHLALHEYEKRFDLTKNDSHYAGINESMSIDQSLHSLFGASKAAADILVQEYGRYFGMNTVCFRAGCLTGPRHSGTQAHGFLSYLMKCAATKTPYKIFGYKGKQVRDNIHSFDLVTAFNYFYEKPRPGEVYNIGGGRLNSCSILEAIQLCEDITGRKMKVAFQKNNRLGDHRWYITDFAKFQSHCPQWRQQYSLKETLEQIFQFNKDRWIRS